MSTLSHKTEYNAIIIGAGIAGLNAARLLSEPALIIDKKKKIGYPVQCGEGISIAALERENIKIRWEWVQSTINQIKRIMPNGNHIGSRHDQAYALVIDRPEFEKNLAQMVPWEIRTDTHVAAISNQNRQWVVKTKSGEIFKAGYLIGADGPTSMVAKAIFGVSNQLVPGINHDVQFKNEIPTHELQMYFGNHIAPYGYGWLFPTSKTTANVGLTQKTKGKIKASFYSFLDTVIRPKFGDLKISQNKSGIIPVNGFSSKNPKDNVFLIGDAGGFTDPIFEGGMNMALYTGHLAADSINQNNPALFKQVISSLPFSAEDLIKARELFYGLDDNTLNDLANVISGKSTSFLNTPEGQKAFKGFPNLVTHQKEIFEFARIWHSAKPYIW